MDTSAGRQITGARNCTKPANGAGENVSRGGMSMIITGITLTIGTTMTTIAIAISAVGLPAPIFEPQEATCQKIDHGIVRAELFGLSL